MILAALGLVIGIIWRLFLFPKLFPLGDIPPQSFLEATAICLLFSLALSVYQIANKE